jgi:hypothetical protein
VLVKFIYGSAVYSEIPLKPKHLYVELEKVLSADLPLLDLCYFRYNNNIDKVTFLVV